MRAIAAGTVKVVGTPSGWSGGGRQVWIQHDGFYSRSLHLSSYSVKNGQRVNEGDIIGVMGATGNVTGVHLHLEIAYGTLSYNGGTQIDPVPFIRARVSTGNWPAYDRYGEAWVKDIQNMLVKLGYELGSYGVDGKDGPATQGAVKDFQKKQGLTVDGIAGPDTKAALIKATSKPVGYNITNRPTADVQRLTGANPDGIYGVDTTAKVMAWQKKNGLTADGIWGPDSDAKGFPAKVKYVPIEVDGDWGPATTRALQDSLGVKVDGELGPETWTAVQKATGNPNVDGELGPETRRYLQASLGVKQDGIVGYDTVAALQQLLNDGRKLQPATVEELEPEPETPMPEQPENPTYPGAVWAGFSPNHSIRESDIDMFIIHHTTETGDVKNLRSYMMRKNDRNVSANWLMAQNGEAHEVVPPEYRAWTSGSIDHRAVTVETMNTSGAPNWGISKESHEGIAQILAWAHRQWGIPLDRKHVIGHKEVPGAATACPGPSMDIDWIVARAIKLNTPEEPSPGPEDGVLVSREWLEKLSADVDGLLT